MYNLPETNTQLVKKPWGWEKWIVPGKDFSYVLKQVSIRARGKSSIHVHKTKRETNLVLKGLGLLHVSPESIDVDRYAKGKYTEEELEKIINSMKTKSIGAGCVYHVLPGFVHQTEAISDFQTVEVSSTELDDIFRIRDEAGRGHGRIEDEHVDKLTDCEDQI